jgi:hypothetical protein
VGVGGDDAAVGADDDRGGTLKDAVGIERLAGSVEADPAGDGVFGEKTFDERGVFVVDGDELDLCGIERGGEGVEDGDIRHAGRAPGRPELKHDDLAAEGCEVGFGGGRRAEDSGEGERRRGGAGFGRLARRLAWSLAESGGYDDGQQGGFVKD